MKPDQKIAIIKQASQLTQEKLAAQLGVSFPTLNSWINGKSIPRKKVQQKIDALYAKLTGQWVIPSDALEAKKQLIVQRAQKLPNVLKKILCRKDLYDEFVLSLTYNSNRIEGSTLTEPETAAILFENAALSDKSIIEHLEVKNHQAALQYLFRHLTEGKGVDEALILKLHAMLMNGIQQDAGQYRRHAVRIVGTHVPTANYLKIPHLMSQLAKDFEKQYRDALAQIAQIHSQFEQIHPFSDGNGRVGRLLMHAMLLQKGLPPALIRQEHRRFYILYLNKSQLENNFSLLEDFLCDAILEAYHLLED